MSAENDIDEVRLEMDRRFKSARLESDTVIASMLQLSQESGTRLELRVENRRGFLRAVRRRVRLEPKFRVAPAPAPRIIAGTK